MSVHQRLGLDPTCTYPMPGYASDLNVFSLNYKPRTRGLIP